MEQCKTPTIMIELSTGNFGTTGGKTGNLSVPYGLPDAKGEPKRKVGKGKGERRNGAPRRTT